MKSRHVSVVLSHSDYARTIEISARIEQEIWDRINAANKATKNATEALRRERTTQARFGRRLEIAAMRKKVRKSC